MPDTHTNTLYYGDNLDVLRRYVPDESVDLIYLDPPFNSNADYNVLFAEKDATEAAAQIKAFEDTWRWDAAAAEAFHEAVRSGHGRVPDAMQGFQSMLGESDMLAYLAMMAPRLIELHRVLKPTGSIYLHCDPTASHYLKLLMDAVFGPENFKNEIIWQRYRAHNDVGQGSRHFGRVHDVLIFYVKQREQKWNQVFVPLDPEYVKKTYRSIEKETGRRYMTTPLTGPGGAEKGNPVFEWKGHTRAWRYNKETFKRLEKEGRLHYSKTGYVRQKKYLDESRGKPVQDVWTDIPSLSGAFTERLGYPTQKPEALLERVIKASSNEDSVVLDPFCGCGTAVAVAQKLNRRWIGIDITHLAINLIKHRLWDSFTITDRSDPPGYRVIGEPTDLRGAEQLATEDPFQFQAWALSLVKARTASSARKGADKGIDGRLFFHDDPEHVSDTKQVILQVKSGKVSARDVRDLKGVLEREKQRGAAIGVLITLRKPTAPMRSEAASAGIYDSPWGTKHARVQVLTVEGLLKGRERIGMPQTGDLRTFKRAPRARKDATPQMSIEYEAGEKSD